MTRTKDVLIVTTGGEKQRMRPPTGFSDPVLGDNGTRPIWKERAGGGASTLDDLTDVTITSPAVGDRLRYDGTEWVNDNRHYVPMTDGDTSFPADLFIDGQHLMVEVPL